MQKRTIVAAAIAAALAVGLTGCGAHARTSDDAAAHESARGSTVPNIVGDTVAQAKRDITGAGLRADAGTADDGDLAVWSDPAPGAPTDPGSIVKITSKAAMVTVPNVVGGTVSAAKSTLAGAGFVVDAGSAGDAFRVSTQTPAASSAVKRGSTVTLIAAPPLTVSQQNAMAKAKSYLSFEAFSREGLIKQLEFEGFSEADATLGTDNTGADWNAQAAAKAKDYLSFESFSHAGLVDQLEFEGFTPDQAEYGVTQVGL